MTKKPAPKKPHPKAVRMVAAYGGARLIEAAPYPMPRRIPNTLSRFKFGWFIPDEDAK